MKLISIIIILITFTSCSGKKRGDKTNTKLVLGGLIAGQTGGLMLYGKNNSGGEFFARAITTIADGNLELNNGNWSFAAIGWSGASAFTGTSRCGHIEGLDLIGDDTNINLTLSTAGCHNPLFGPRLSRGSNDQFKPLRLFHCANDGDIKGIDVNECIPGNAQSYTLRLPESGLFGGSGLSSGCKIIPSLPHDTGMFVPIFEKFDSTAVPFEITLHSQLGCAGQSEVFHFANNLHSGITDRARVDFMDDKIGVFMRNDNYCTGAALTNSPYAQGTVDISGYNYICTRAQLDQIMANTAHETYDYILMADLDMANAPHTPIGNSGNPFTGTFNGNHKLIKNLDIQAASSGQGFFGYVNGATIDHMEFDNITIDITAAGAAHSIGGLIGKCYGSSEIMGAKAQLITINDSQSAAHYGIGGIIGYVSNGCTLGDATVNDVVVNNSNTSLDKLGGIIGYMSDSLTGSQLIQAEVLNFDGSANLAGAKIGGIVGTIDGASVEVYDVKAAVNIVGPNINQVGGIVGMIVNNAVLAMARATGTMQVDKSGYLEAGGIVGTIVSGKATWVINEINISSASGDKIGGIAGSSNGEISYAFNSGIIGGNGNEIAGIAGAVSGSSGTILFSHNSGDVSPASGTYVGGLAGSLTSASSISHSANIANISGTSNVGGLVGKMDGSVLTQSYSLGTISGTSSNTGGLVGITPGSTSSITLSYSNVTLSGGGSSQNHDFGANPTTPIASNLYSAVTGLSSTVPTNINNATTFTNFLDADWNLTSSSAPTHVWHDPIIALGGPRLGTHLEPFELTHPNQWNAVADHAHLLGRVYILKNDLDFSLVNSFIPWGGEDATAAEFKGTLMGNGYTIRNVNYNLNYNDVGLIRVLGSSLNEGGGNIMHYDHHNKKFFSLYLDNINMTGVNNVGTLAGRVENADSSIEHTANNVTSVFIDSNSSANGNDQVGGVFGKINIRNDQGVIFQIKSLATVVGNNNVGGIAGQFLNNGGPTVTISHLVNNGTVTGNNNVGGILGNQGTSTILFGAGNYANVTGYDYVGGVTGANAGLLEQTYSRNNTVSGNDKVGGLIGKANGGGIQDSYSGSDITATIKGGGVMGIWLSGSLSGSYVSGQTFSIGGGDEIIGEGSPSSFSGNYSDSGLYSTTAISSPYAEASYSGLDFNSKWTIKEGIGYPELQIERYFIHNFNVDQIIE